MLGTVMGHADEKALLHSVLLGSPLDLSQSLLLPVLHIHNRETGHFDATPAANLALSPGDPPYCMPSRQPHSSFATLHDAPTWLRRL